MLILPWFWIIVYIIVFGRFHTLKLQLCNEIPKCFYPMFLFLSWNILTYGYFVRFVKSGSNKKNTDIWLDTHCTTLICTTKLCYWQVQAADRRLGYILSQPCSVIRQRGRVVKALVLGTSLRAWVRIPPLSSFFFNPAVVTIFFSICFFYFFICF